MMIAVLEDGPLALPAIVKAAREGGHTVVIEKRTVKEFREAVLRRVVREHKPIDCFVVDLKIDGGTKASLALLEDYMSKYPNAHVLVQSDHIDRRLMPLLLQPRPGAYGALSKEIATREKLIDTFDRLSRNIDVCDVRIYDDAIETLVQRRSAVVQDLSPVLNETLRLMAQGYTNGAIAKKLNVSPGVVPDYVRNILTRLGLDKNQLENSDDWDRRVRAVLMYLQQMAYKDLD